MGGPGADGVTGERLLSPRRLRELAVVVVLAVALVAGQEWLPTDGWGLALRWAVRVVLAVSVVVWLGGLGIAAVREFRRGLADEG